MTSMYHTLLGFCLCVCFLFVPLHTTCAYSHTLERCHQPVRTVDLSLQVKMILALRNEINRDATSLHAKVPLSKAARTMLHERTRVSKSFCRGFLARHQDKITFGKEQGIEEHRARWSTRGVWQKHFVELADVLQLVTHEGKVLASQVANLDECPSTIDGTSLGYSFGTVRKPRLRSKSAHSENITYCPCYSMNGEPLLHQIIVRASGYEDDMETRVDGFVHGRHIPHVPKRLLKRLQDRETIVFDFTEKSCQTGFTFTCLIRNLIDVLNKKQIAHTKQTPFILILDGHKSHVNVEALRIAKENNIRYVSLSLLMNTNMLHD
eukprot:m.330954 g.330954  ORF g.330954 m.330954 type:complete len:322 (+) comp16051_c0_seq3:134-1099(+)